VGNENGGSLTVIDGTKHTVLTTIKIPKAESMPTEPRPMGVVISPDGRTLFSSLGRAKAIAVIDVQKRAHVRTIENVGARPWGIALSGDGRKIYTANGSSADVSVIDAETGKVEKQITTGGSPWGVVVAVTPR
jgi:YVTN family beta-propeller protein